MNKKILILFFLFGLIFSLFSNDNSNQRGFMFTLGIGPAMMYYPSEVENELNSLENLSGVERVTIYFEALAGWSVTPKSYVSISFNGFGDRLEDSDGDYMQLSTVSYCLGIRHYPFTTGLVLGGEVGRSKIGLSSSSTQDLISDSGYNIGIIVAYDFDRSLSGFTFQIGTKAAWFEIEGDRHSGVCLYGNLLWK